MLIFIKIILKRDDISIKMKFDLISVTSENP
jgi:hypothetical protein